MSSSNAPVKLELKASRIGFALWLLLHAIAAAAIVLSSPPGWLLAGAWALWGLSLAYTLYQQHRLPHELQAILHHRSGWQLGFRDRGNGAVEAAELLPNAFVTAPVMVLRFRLLRTGKTIRVSVWQDSGHRDDIRRLRVRVLHPVEATES